MNLLIFSLESLCGFIHNLSPVKRSKRTDWFDFHLQTSPSKVQRVVGFNIPSHSTFSGHNKSKTPVLLSNTKKNDSNKDIIFNQQSIVRSAPAFDIDFDYSPDIAASESSSSSVQPATTITLEQVPTLKINQKVNVTATISLGSEQPKPVEVKSTQKMTLVKEDCVLEDETGTAEIHIWDELINNVKNGTTYEFQNLNVKHFKGSAHLATTPATTFKEASKQLKSVQGPTLLENPEKEVKVEMFKFLNNLSIFVACQACRRKITESAHQKYIKCRNCGVRQRQGECKRDASVQVKVEIAGKEIWLTAFTKEIESLLALSPELSLMSDSESIEDHLMDLKDIHFTYNVNKNTITQVTSLSNGLAQ